MRLIFTVQALVVVLGTALLFPLRGRFDALSFGAGSGMVLLNVYLLAQVWKAIFNKKLIALALAIIVLKYAAFTIALYWLFKSDLLSPLFFLMGFSTLILTAVVAALGKKSETNTNGL